jgi:pyrimidine deaminase RibD-like protein
MDIGQERRFMEAAIAASRKSHDDRTGGVPRVGAVAVGNEIISEAYRDFETGDHAEYLLLESTDHPIDSLVGATVYTTLEPCTERGTTREGKKKIPCVERLIERKVDRVVIGMLDPNPIVRGLGFRKLRAANIKADVFPDELMAEVEDINRGFVRAMENNPIHRVMQEIATLATKSNKRDPQIQAVRRVLDACSRDLQCIHRGQIPILGKEAAYFDRWLEIAENFKDTQKVKAYIRIAAFDPKDLLKLSWFNHFYERLAKLVRSGKLSIRYVFLVGEKTPGKKACELLDRYKEFSEEIRIVENMGQRLSAAQLRPSIVLFETQKVAFTHDRSDSGEFLGGDEWIFEEGYNRLDRQFAQIELESGVYFSRNQPQ